jgi:phosphotransferase system enzyme I (PtsI)
MGLPLTYIKNTLLRFFMIKGIPAAPGVAIGIALIIKDEELIIPKYISSFDLEEARLGQAIQSAKLELKTLKTKTLENLGDDKAQIFDAQIMILENAELLKQTLIKIREESVNAEYALKAVANRFIADLVDHASDIRDVTSSLLYRLLKKKKISLENLGKPVILIARDLSLSQEASLDRKNVLGLLTDIGVKSSHTAIMARALDIPAIVGLGDFSKTVKDGDRIAFDGETGEVKLNPTSDQIEILTSRHNTF